jgi:hypothetical protein
MSPGIVGNTSALYESARLKLGHTVIVLKSSDRPEHKVLVNTVNGDLFAYKGDEYKVIQGPQQLSRDSLLFISVEKHAQVKASSPSGYLNTIYDGIPYRLFPETGYCLSQTYKAFRTFIVASNHHVEVFESINSPDRKVLLNTRNRSVFASKNNEYQVRSFRSGGMSNDSLLSITVEAEAIVELVIHDPTSGEEVDHQMCLGPSKLIPIEGHHFLQTRD